jgi:hypothetical protein
MGVTVHYRGTLKVLDRLGDFEDRIRCLSAPPSS